MKRAAFLAWPLLGSFVLSFEATVRLLLGAPMTVHGFVWGWVGWMEWMLFAPFIVLLTMRFRYRPAALRTFALVHAIAPFLFSAMHSLLYFGLRIAILGSAGSAGQSLGEAWLERLPTHLTLDFLVYGGCVLATHVVIFLRATWEREEERLGLERRIAQAEVDLLKVQLPPDVVADQLRDIECAIEHGPMRGAEERIHRFSGFLRQSLAASKADIDDEVPLAIEEEDAPDSVPRPLSLPVRFLIILGIVPGVVLVLNAFAAVGALAHDRPIAWRAAWENVSLSWFSWPVTLLMVWLGSRTRRIALLACAAAAAPPLWDLGFHTTLSGWPAARMFLLSSSRTVDFLVFFGIALGAVAYERYRTWREEAVEIAELDARLLRMRARLLRLQLNPHFLFNTLNSIAALLDDDRVAARTMAARLRVFVDHVLTTFDRQEVPLREEIEVLMTYVGIENVRFGDRLLVELRIGDGAQDALVPSLLLQPLVENALRHGLGPASGGRVTITAALEAGELRLEVRDTGKSRGAMREGIGLANTRARLRQLHGDAFTFEIARGEDGFRARLAIPA